VEIHFIAQDQDIEKCAFCRQSDVDAVLGHNAPILEHSQDRGQTISSALYCAMLGEDMKPAIRSKRRGMLTDGAVLLHDISRPQTVAATVEMIRTLKFELLPHRVYSANLTRYDYHIFKPPKDALRGR
jgi:hypothetical protein